MYTVFFISFVFSSTCFGCYLHPSSGAQLPRTAIGCVSVENRGFSIKWCGCLFCMDLFVLIFQSLAWYFCAGVCVIVSVLVLCGHDVWFLVLYLFVYGRFWCVIPLEQVLVFFWPTVSTYDMLARYGIPYGLTMDVQIKLLSLQRMS
jgi:hypothetical protein